MVFSGNFCLTAIYPLWIPSYWQGIESIKIFFTFLLSCSSQGEHFILPVNLACISFPVTFANPSNGTNDAPIPSTISRKSDPFRRLRQLHGLWELFATALIGIKWLVGGVAQKSNVGLLEIVIGCWEFRHRYCVISSSKKNRVRCTHFFSHDHSTYQTIFRSFGPLYFW